MDTSNMSDSERAQLLKLRLSDFDMSSNINRRNNNTTDIKTQKQNEGFDYSSLEQVLADTSST